MNTILFSLELATLQNLNCVQMIKQHSELIIKVANSARSQSNILEELGLGTTNNRARLNIKTFLEKNYIPIPVYSQKLGTKPEHHSKEEILKRFIIGDKYYGSSLRKWVLGYDLIPYKCALCTLNTPEWNGNPLTFDLDHENGNNKDNRLKNLRFLCPNCHSQTETYKGKNIGGKKTKIILPNTVQGKIDNLQNIPNREKLLLEVNSSSKTQISAKYNITVYALNRLLKGTSVNYIQPLRTVYPPVEVMVARVKVEGYEKLAGELNVSGNAIRKYLAHELGEAPKRVLKSSAVDGLCVYGNKKKADAKVCGTCLKTTFPTSGFPSEVVLREMISVDGITVVSKRFHVSRATIYRWFDRQSSRLKGKG